MDIMPMRIYRLEITAVPPESETPGWAPEKWTPRKEGEVFTWRVRRHFISIRTARYHKRKLESWGAHVVLRPSLPVAWPGADLPVTVPGDVVAAFLSAWTTDMDMRDTVLTSLNCEEAGSLAAVLRAFGAEDSATDLIAFHAVGDDQAQGDVHHGVR